MISRYDSNRPEHSFNTENIALIPIGSRASNQHWESLYKKLEDCISDNYTMHSSDIQKIRILEQLNRVAETSQEEDKIRRKSEKNEG